MMMLVNCSGCRTPLQLPPGARSIQCVVCRTITQIADPRAVGPPPSHHAGPPAPSPHSHAPPPPSPYSHAPPGPPPSPHGRKKAVICGISYKFSRHELKGCINDAKCMRYLLINKFQFPSESIIMLTEEETDPYKTPTKQNLRMALFWLVNGCQPGDSLVFHYSGHGSRQRNYNGDEVDGYDETLCPLDFETQGMIVDDEINAAIVRPLPRGVKLHAIIDACHSGTVLDLPFLCRMSRSGQYFWEDHRPRSGVWKGSNGGEVISISGCDDDQTSADTAALSQVTSTGAMTYCFIKAIENGQASTYGSMLKSMRATIRKDGNSSGGALGGGVVTSLLTMLVSGGSVSGGLTQNMASQNVVLLCRWGGEILFDGPRVEYSGENMEPLTLEPNMTMNDLMNEVHSSIGSDPMTVDVHIKMRFETGNGVQVLPVSTNKHVTALMLEDIVNNELSVYDVYTNDEADSGEEEDGLQNMDVEPARMEVGEPLVRTPIPWLHLRMEVGDG